MVYLTSAVVCYGDGRENMFFGKDRQELEMAFTEFGKGDADRLVLIIFDGSHQSQIGIRYLGNGMVLLGGPLELPEFRADYHEYEEALNMSHTECKT
ncbi:MAG: hypothetical protein HY454_02580 [Parcubacteria group bacterium]|nr:hypothetical protein [Parcubacteria group bacterium]